MTQGPVLQTFEHIHTQQPVPVAVVVAECAQRSLRMQIEVVQVFQQLLLRMGKSGPETSGVKIKQYIAIHKPTRATAEGKIPTIQDPKICDDGQVLCREGDWAYRALNALQFHGEECCLEDYRPALFNVKEVEPTYMEVASGVFTWCDRSFTSAHAAAWGTESRLFRACDQRADERQIDEKGDRVKPVECYRLDAEFLADMVGKFQVTEGEESRMKAALEFEQARALKKGLVIRKGIDEPHDSGCFESDRAAAPGGVEPSEPKEHSLSSEEWLPGGQAAKLFNLRGDQVTRWCNTGRVKHVGKGRDRRVNMLSLIQFMRTQKVGNAVDEEQKDDYVVWYQERQLKMQGQPHHVRMQMERDTERDWAAYRQAKPDSGKRKKPASGKRKKPTSGKRNTT